MAGDIDSTPNTFTAVTAKGNISVILHSGSIAGTVTILGTTLIAGVPISSSATPISIGGGVASASHFTLARKPINLEGFKYANLQSTVSAYLADRFGNYNVLNGTAVSFYTEAGAIDAQGITGGVIGTNVTGIDATAGDTGAANVILRTQLLMPEDVPPAIAGDAVSNAYFNDVINNGNEPYYTSGTHTFNPRDGWVTVLAVTRGEETFLDENHDGLFTRSYKQDQCPYTTGVICECDGGTAGVYAGYVHQGEKCSDPGKPGGMRSEGFIDLPNDPFYDVNDDRLWDDGQTFGHPFELFIDTNRNDIFDGTNGKWDGPDCQSIGCEKNKTIWTDMKMVFSDETCFYLNPVNNVYTTPKCYTDYFNGNFADYPLGGIARGTTGSFHVIIGDKNLNYLQGGTTISVTATAGSVASEAITLADVLSLGPTPFYFTVAMSATETSTETKVTIKVVTPDGILTEQAITIPII